MDYLAIERRRIIIAEILVGGGNL